MSLKNFIEGLSADQFKDLEDLLDEKKKSKQFKEDFQGLQELKGSWFTTENLMADIISNEIRSGQETFKLIKDFCQKYQDYHFIVVSLSKRIKIPKAFGSFQYVFGEGKDTNYSASHINKVESIMTLEEWKSDPVRKYYLENNGCYPLGKMIIYDPDRGFSLEALKGFSDA